MREQDGLILAIDTCTEQLGVALYCPKTQRTWVHAHVAQRNQAALLHEVVQEVMDQAGATFEDVAAVAVTRGPGSFTGIRVGLSAAKGYALALDKPLIALSTFEALAFPHHGEEVMAWVDAWGGDIYAQHFGADGTPLAAPLNTALSEALASVSSAARVVGNVPANHKLDMPKEIRWDEKDQFVCPAMLAKAAYAVWQRGEGVNTTPMYVHKLTYKKLADQGKPEKKKGA